jgi:cytochrome c peroxidase
MFWDLRALSLEAQALEPIKAFEEMRGDVYSESEALTEVVARLARVAEYRALFRRLRRPSTGDSRKHGQGARGVSADARRQKLTV